MKNKFKLFLNIFISITQTCLSQTNFWQATSGPQSHVYSLLRHTNGNYIAGCDGAVFYSTNNGNQWNQATGLPSTRVITMTQTPNGDIFGGTISGYVFRSTDIGISWNQANPGWPAVGVFGITSNSLGFVFATNSVIFKTTDNGVSWTSSALPTPTLPYIYSITIDASSNLYTGTYDYGIFKSSDTGVSWTPCGGNFTGLQVRTLMFDSIGGFWASASGNVFFSTDRGTTWESRSTNLPNNSIGSIVINTNRHLFVATNDSGIFRSKNYGKYWTHINTGFTSLVTTSLVLEPSGFILAGTSVGVFRSLQSTTLFSLPRDSLVFDTVNVGQSLIDSLLVINNGTEILNITSILTNIPDFSVSPQSASLSVGQEMWFQITFVPQYFGTINDTAKFISNANTSPDEVYLTGTGKAPFIQCPKNFSIGRVLINSIKDSLIIFTSIGNDTLKISNISLNDEHFSFSPTMLQIPPNQYFEDTVKFAPTIPGEISTIAIIISNSISSPDTISVSGIGDTTITRVSTANENPTRYKLYQNYPNPFNPITIIDYYIPQRSFVSLRVYDLKGSEIKTLVSEEKATGKYSITWDGTDNNNNKVSSSIYFYKFESKGNIIIRKMVLLK